MLTPDQKNEYEDLKKDVNERDKYLKPTIWLDRLFFFLLVASFALLLLDVWFFNILIIAYVFLVVFLFAILYFYLINPLLKYLARRNTPSADRLVTFYTYAIIENLDSYYDPHKADTVQSRKKYRKMAIKNAHELELVVEKNWVVGDFKLGKKFLGESVCKFKELLSQRLVTNIEEGDPETFLHTTNDILYNFSIFLSNPSVPDLVHINERIATLPEIVTKKENFVVKLLRNRVIECVVWIGTVAIVAYFIYFLGTTYGNVSRDGAFNAAVTFAAIGIFAYFPITFLRSRKSP